MALELSTIARGDGQGSAMGGSAYDDAESDRAHLQSHVPSEASGTDYDPNVDDCDVDDCNGNKWDGDADQALGDIEAVLRSSFDGDADQGWLVESDGQWGDVAALQHSGQFGLLVANWGGCYTTHQDHIDFDVKSCAASFVLAQEATQIFSITSGHPGRKGFP